MTHRIAIVGMWHETNTYAPNPADRTAFEHFELLEIDAIVDRHVGTRTVIGGFLSRSDVTYLPTLAAGAWPSGPAPDDLIRELLGRVSALLEQVGDVQGVLVNLHGAMVSAGLPDIELEVLRTIRAVVGDVPIAAVLDLHANPSHEFVKQTDIVLSYDTYPHVDMFERGAEAVDLLVQVIEGRQLETVVAKAPILTCPLVQGTSSAPMLGLLERARARAASSGVARIGITAGFAYSDVDRAGISVLVVADKELDRSARTVANETLRDIESEAANFVVSRPLADEAVRTALESPQRPTVLVDVADNIGGGAAGDGTDLLVALIEQDAPSAVVVIADDAVVAQAFEAGIGGRVSTYIGAKADNLHGRPVKIEGVVEVLTDGCFTSHGSYMTGQQFSMGLTARLRVGGIQIIVTSIPTPPFHREQMTSVGIQPEDVDLVVAKGALAWKAAIDRPARVLEVSTHGACPIDLDFLARDTQPTRVLA